MIREQSIVANIMKANTSESKIIASVLERLKEIRSVQAVNLRHEDILRDRAIWDGEVTLKTDRGEFPYVFEIKTHLRPQAIRHLHIQAETLPKRGFRAKELLLFADYVNPILSHQLKEGGINFIDTAGNMFLKREPGLYVYVEGRKPVVQPKVKTTRLFQPSGLTMLFGLLLEPESINLSYRDLARTNGVALGTVGWVKRDLREHGYLEPIGKDRFCLVRKKDLLDRWVQGYASRLRPKIFLAEFKAATDDLDESLVNLEKYAREHQIRWGLSGGWGADELVHHHRGSQLTLFVEEWPNSAQKELTWLPAEKRPITLLKAFSPRIFNSVSQDTAHPVVHPLLIYAELLYQGKDRDLETARLIYSKYLEKAFDKD